MKLSAVIATADRGKELDETFKTIVMQSRPFDEIIIADSSSDESTKDLVEKWSGQLPLKYLECDVRSAAIQRDRGVSASTGDIIYFLDDDVLLENKYVAEIADIFEKDEEGKIGGVSGTIVNQTYGKPGWVTRLYLHLMAGNLADSYAGRVIGPGINLLPEDSGADIKQVEWMPTCACAYRKTAFDTAGGFGEAFKGYSMCEDVYLSTRIGRHWHLVNTRRARLYHKDLGGKTHKNWREIGKMSVINRWKVVRESLEADTLLNKFKLGLYLFFEGAIALRNVITGKEKFKTAKERFIGQLSGYITVITRNGYIN